MITAIVFVRTDVQRVNEVAVTLAGLDGVSEVYSVTGDLDLVVMVRVRNLDEVSRVVTDRVARVPGIVDTQTHIAFQTHSRHDLEAAFSLGAG